MYTHNQKSVPPSTTARECQQTQESQLGSHSPGKRLKSCSGYGEKWRHILEMLKNMDQQDLVIN